MNFGKKLRKNTISKIFGKLHSSRCFATLGAPGTDEYGVSESGGQRNCIPTPPQISWLAVFQYPYMR